MNPLRTLIAIALAVASSAAGASAATVTFRVQVPASTPAAGPVHIAGDFQAWNPGSPAHALSLAPDGRWEITLELPDAAPIQYKFTRGSWASVEKGPSGEEIANRTLTPSGTQTINLTVANWADLGPSTITGNVEPFTFAPFLSGRRCWVYLPPGYAQSSARYPVLYMHDGQNLFDQYTSFAGEWRVDEACEALITAEEIGPIIVVGIENAGAGRCNEYTPFFRAGGSPCTGGGADAYLQAIRDVLIPEINARYRTRTGPGNTSMSGSSLGGLVSAYAAYAYAPTFGRIAAVSPSYWFRRTELFPFVQAQSRPATLDRFYQDMGTGEGQSNIDHLRDFRDILLAQGFSLGADLLSIEAAGAGHNESAWASRFPEILRFLFDPPCPADFDSSGAPTIADIFAMLAAWFAHEPQADLNQSGDFEIVDIFLFLSLWFGGCP